MLPYIGRRLLATIPVMAVVAVVVFSLLRLTAGDPAAIIAGDNATSQDVAAIRARLGLDRPLAEQFAIWVGRVVRGGVGGFLERLVLPSITLAVVFVALIARITRASVLEVLNADHVRTARAKGLGELPVLLRHVLRNAAVPIVTVIGIGIAVLIGGV